MKQTQQRLPLKPRCLEAQEWETMIREEAVHYDLDLRVSYPEQRGRKGVRPTLHWRFVDINNGLTVLHYWPGSGKVKSRDIQGAVEDCWDALGLAKEQAARLWLEEAKQK